MAINNTQNSWLTQIVGAVMSIAILASSWFLTQAWNRINKVEDSVHQMEINVATTDGNRFTSMDWVVAKNALDAKQTDIDRRVMRLEETSVIIKESLIRIENAVIKHTDSGKP